MTSKTGIVKSASLDFHHFRSKSKLFNEIKVILTDCLRTLHLPNPEYRIRALSTLHQLICRLSKDSTSLSKITFEATQLDEKLLLFENICNLLEANPPSLDFSPEIESFWILQTEKCLLIIQGVACFCPETTEYFLNIPNFKIIINLMTCNHSEIVKNTLETIQCILGTSPEHLRTFEQTGGVYDISNLAKRKDFSLEVRIKCVEFLWFYLLPEFDSTQTTLSISHEGNPIRIKSIQEKQKNCCGVTRE